jgi:hypothetical protein
MPKFNPMDMIGGIVGGMNPAGAIIGSIVGQVLKQPDVPIANERVPETMNKVAQAVADAVHEDKIAVVPVKSGWGSKINWVQLAAPVATILAAFGLPLTADQIIALFVVGQMGQSVLTFVIRQWFTKSVTASSMKGT